MCMDAVMFFPPFLFVFSVCYLLWDCALVFGDSQHLQCILLGIDPRIENVMVCVPREWLVFWIHEVHIFSLWTATSLIALHFLLSVAYFAQFHCSCTHIFFGTWLDVDFYGQIYLEGILFHANLWVAPFFVPISCGSERWDFCLGLRPGSGIFVWGFAVLGFLWVRFMIWFC